MGDDSGAEEAAGELELLRSMYEEEDLTVDEADTVTVSLVLIPAVDARVTTTLVARLPAGYPRTEPPAVAFTGSRGLSDGDISKLQASVAQEIEDSAGATCLFQAIEAARSVLDGCNFSDTQHTCAICLQLAAAASTFTPPCFHSFHRSCLGRWVDQLHSRRMASSSVRGQADAVNARLRAAQGDAENRKALVQRLQSEAAAVGKQCKRAEKRLKQLEGGADLREGESLSAVKSLVDDLQRKGKRLDRKVQSAQARVSESGAALERAQASAHAALERQRSEQLVVPCPVCRKPIDAGEADELRSTWRAEHPEEAAAAAKATAARASVASGAGGAAGAGAPSGGSTQVEGSWGSSDDGDSGDEAGAGGGDGDGALAPEDAAWLREYVEFQRAREAELVRQAQKISGHKPRVTVASDEVGASTDGTPVLVVGSRARAHDAHRDGDVGAGKENVRDAGSAGSTGPKHEGDGTDSAQGAGCGDGHGTGSGAMSGTADAATKRHGGGKHRGGRGARTARRHGDAQAEGDKGSKKRKKKKNKKSSKAPPGQAPVSAVC